MVLKPDISFKRVLFNTETKVEKRAMFHVKIKNKYKKV